MKIKFIRQYRKTTGVMVYVYGVHGTEAQIAEYKAACEAREFGKFIIDEDTNQPLFFTTNFIGQTGKLVANSKGEFRADTTALEQLKSLTDQFGIEIAMRQMGGQVKAPTAEPEPDNDPEPELITVKTTPKPSANGVGKHK